MVVVIYIVKILLLPQWMRPTAASWTWLCVVSWWDCGWFQEEIK